MNTELIYSQQRAARRRSEGPEGRMLALLLVAGSPLLLAATDASSYGYAASITRSDDAPSPAPPQPSPADRPTLAAAAPLYTTRGAIEVDTNENTLFMWHEKLYVLENM
jgi:hypothetical protein